MVAKKLSSCPFEGNQSQADNSIPPKGHDQCWDLAESADLLYANHRGEESDLEGTAREAWRNAVRCIGRRLWKTLRVIDCRSIDKPDDIFDALLNHLRKATNGGKILPVMTIFREWLPDEPELRVWSRQLLRYAGYESNGGTVLGDPANIQLTRIALSLGWRPPAEPSPFDLLPIIIQAGDKLHFYEIPKTEALEVSIRHPKYPFMEKMGLKWYAVPAVSDMIFASGNALYPMAPFNGSYMGTEIGARNFGDETRYNLLPEVAHYLELDTTTGRSLWKDHALLVLNEAVLWSFDKEGVRITDHHHASEGFLKFCKQEEQSGRNVSADWSWIVPPISGSATSVFHRNYDLQPIYPNFLLQVSPWDTKRGQALICRSPAQHQQCPYPHT
jgi:nitric-oxide synthase